MTPRYAVGRVAPVPAAAAALQLIATLIRVDARRPATWLGMMGAVSGGWLIAEMPAGWLLPLAFANGVVAAVLACGNVPAAAGLLPLHVGSRWLAAAWVAERTAWVFCGLALALLLKEPETVATATPIVCMAAAGGLAASLAMVVCRGVGASTADTVSGVFGVTVLAVLVATGMQPGWPAAAQLMLAGAVWAGLVAALAAVSVVSDRSPRVAREVTAGSGPLGHSPLRRWYDRLLMAGALLGMVRWLLATEPHAALYGVVAALSVASLTFPEVLLGPKEAAAASWGRLAWQEGAPLSHWRHLRPVLLATVVTGWPLVIATALLPTARSADALLAAAALACVVALASAGRAVLPRYWLARETAFAAATLMVWLATLGILRASTGESGVPAIERLPPWM